MPLKEGESNVPWSPKDRLEAPPMAERQHELQDREQQSPEGRRTSQTLRTRGHAGTNRHRWQNRTVVIGLLYYKILTDFI
jgi:hypothetical protein